MLKEEFRMFLRSYVGNGFICNREQSRDMGENKVFLKTLQLIHVEIKNSCDRHVEN